MFGVKFVRPDLKISLLGLIIPLGYYLFTYPLRNCGETRLIRQRFVSLKNCAPTYPLAFFSSLSVTNSQIYLILL